MRFIIVLCLILWGNILSAQNEVFHNYTTSDGLVHKFVYNIIRDSDGFIWVATSNGLSRFDSHNFKNYTHLDNKPKSIQGSAIYGLVEGKDKKIWLSTDAGLECFNKVTEEFSLIDNELLKGVFFLKDIYVDNDGLIWVYNHERKFIAYDPEKDSVVRHIDTIAGKPIDDLLIIDHFLIDKNILWLACKSGKALYDLNKNQFKMIDTLHISHCHSIRKSGENTIVVTDMHDGLYIINIAKQSGRWITKDFIEKSIGRNVSFYDAIIEDDGTLWASVSPGIVSIKDEKVSYYSHNSRISYFDGNVVSCFYIDNDKNMWLGTYDYGVFLKKKKNSSISFVSKLYKDDIKKTFISNFNVFSDSSLIYTDNKGVYFCENYKHLTTDCAKKIFNFSAPSLHSVNSRYCLISERDTVYVYDSENRSLSISHTVIAAASGYIDKDGVIWCGSWGGYLSGYDKKNNKQYRIELGKNNMTFSPVYDVTGNGDGDLILGTFGAGLVYIKNPKSEHPELTYFNAKQTGNHYIPSNNINCLLFDENENLWIGTNGGGLIKSNKDLSEMYIYNITNGLKSNVIEGIVSDINGNIWFTSNVITKLNVADNDLTHFSQAEGVNGHFSTKACKATQDGKILFAGSAGLYVLDPKMLSNKIQVATPVITNVRINGTQVNVGDTLNKCVPLRKQLMYTATIKLPYDLNSLSFDFVSINFQDKDIIQYQYKLVGVDNDWSYLGNHNRQISYANISPGAYILKVRASLDGETWSKIKELAIEISPPWWKTLGFKIAFALIIVLIIYMIIRMRLRAILKEQVKLKRLVEERTYELQKTNNELKSHVNNLKESKLVIEMKNKELIEALNIKDKLITIIAHDFKNPLQAILGFTSKLQKKIHQFDLKEIIKSVGNIGAASQNLNNQMTTVLEWAMSEEKEITFNPSEINIETIVNDSIQLIDEIAKQKQVTILKQFDYLSYAFVDPRMISTVVRNLLINALKFTSQKGTIAITVQEFDTEIEVAVIDSGVGIASDDLDKIFETTYTSDKSGTGIGLPVCKLFVEKNNGEIYVKSNLESGSVFTFTVPKGNTITFPENYENNKGEDFDSDDLDGFVENRDITVLVIDDNENVTLLLQEFFSTYYNVIVANDGKTGLQLARNTIPSIIITDISMPLISGTELCETLKKDQVTSHIPIILITANNKLFEEGYASGADDFVLKPFEEKELLFKTKALLENRHRLLSHKSHANEDDIFLLPESYDDVVMKKILNFIKDNFCNNELDSKLIGNEFGLSKTQLWRKFKSETGKNISDYIRDLRLEKAKFMLLTGKYKVSEIGYDVGFATPQHFSKSFSKKFGISPKEFCNNKTEG